jgi:hypothetical protein
VTVFAGDLGAARAEGRIGRGGASWHRSQRTTDHRTVVRPAIRRAVALAGLDDLDG